MLTLTKNLLVCGALVGCALAFAQEKDAKQWTLNIQDGEIRQLAENVAMITGKTITLDPRVKGTVTIISESNQTKDEIYNLFKTVLRVHGYGTVESDEIVRVIQTQTLKSWTDDSLMNLEGADPDDFVTQVVMLDNIKSSEIIKVLRQMIPQYGHLSSVAEPNAIVMVDYADNMERNLSVIKQLDVINNLDTIVIQLEHAWVTNIVNILRELLPPAIQSGSVLAIANERNNSVVLRGSTSSLAAATDAVSKLDIPTVSNSNTLVIPIQHGSAESISSLLQALLFSSNIETNSSNSNKVLPQEDLNAVVARGNPSFITEVQNLVARLDTPKPQVLFEAAIVEITVDDRESLGTEFGAVDESGGNIPIASTTVGGLLSGLLGELAKFEEDESSNLTRGVAGLSAVTSPSIGIAKLDPDGVSFGAIINALSRTTQTDLLSTPHVIGADNKEADIFVGLDIPQRQGAFGFGEDTGLLQGSRTSIKRADVGVQLTVTPHVASDLSVRMEVTSEISAVTNTELGIGASGFSDVVINKRSITTTVTAANRQTIVLGGLIRDDVTKNSNGVPGLRRIPLLGRLFRSNSTNNNKTHLLIFLRPTVLESTADIVAETQRKYNGIWQVKIDAASEELETPPPIDDLYEGRR